MKHSENACKFADSTHEMAYLPVCRYISRLESAQAQYITQINDLKEVSVLYLLTMADRLVFFSILRLCHCAAQQ